MLITIVQRTNITVDHQRAAKDLVDRKRDDDRSVVAGLHVGQVEVDENGGRAVGNEAAGHEDVTDWTQFALNLSCSLRIGAPRASFLITNQIWF